MKSDNESNQNDIPVGGQVLESVSQGEHGTQAPQIGGMEETAARLRERIEADGGTPQGGLSRNVREIENRVTREYAQENGLWIPFEDVFKLGRPSKSGNEHDTYLNAEQGVIYKVNNRMNTPSILDLLDRMEQHNQYFPDSKYSLVGFTAISENGDVWPVFAQDYVPGARVATNEEIDAYMGALGFAPVGEGRYSNGEIVAKDLRPRNVLVDADGDVYVVDAEFEQAVQEKKNAALENHARGIAQRLGVNVTLHNDASTIADESVMMAIADGEEVKGWYNPRTGEIALYMPNMESVRDVESTILHEAVSHYGIKHLLGREEFNKFLDGVWQMMPASERARYLQYVNADMSAPSLANMRAAADEYVAHLAEDMDLNDLEKGVWQRIVDYVMNVLRGRGFTNLSYADVESVIRASYANLRTNAEISQAEVFSEGESMLSKRESERRKEKNRINNVIDTAVGIVLGSKETAKNRRLKSEAERRELAKEIYSSVLKGDFNDVTLSQIDKFIEDATPANPFGRRISQRLPQRMERALREGARTNAVDALFSRICESAVPANERFSEAGRRAIEERKKELLKGWAIATGNWHTDLKEFTDDTEPIGEGKDSKVYMSKDGNTVIKASKGKLYGKRFRPDIDNIALFNDVFRNSRYEILGYGEIGGEFVRILQQPFVDFAESTPLTSEERGEYMQSLGFEPLNDANTAFADGEIVIADLQKGNVVRDAAGNISVIDADAKLHTKDVGGDYTYPPVETDLPEGDFGENLSGEE